MRYAIRLLLILFIANVPSGHTRMIPAEHSGSPAADAGPIAALRSDLNSIFSDPLLARAQIGVKILSIDRAETLYERDSERLFVPASSNKIITAAAALVRLGPDYRFETRVFTDGTLENGILNGNLIVIGTGDPTNSPGFHGGEPFAVFRDLAAALKEKKIGIISGAVIGDEKAYSGPRAGLGWEWNDLPQAFAAPVSALQFNNNMLAFEISPGAEKDGFASIRTTPLDNYAHIVNRIVTTAQNSPADIRLERADLDETVHLSGTVPLNGGAFLKTAAVQNPARYYLAALQHVLSQEKMLSGTNPHLNAPPADPSKWVLLWTHTSPPLIEVIKPLLKESINLYAETLVRTLGMEFRGQGSFDKGKEVVEEVLNGMGIASGSYSYADGSGLSRLNLQSPGNLVRVLECMSKEKGFRQFYDSLPIAGVDGTLATRMRRTKADNNVRAKTGTMTHVSSIAGYIKTVDGETLAFAIAANNYPETKSAAEAMQDRALQRLAAFSRTGRSE